VGNTIGRLQSKGKEGREPHNLSEVGSRMDEFMKEKFRSLKFPEKNYRGVEKKREDKIRYHQILLRWGFLGLNGWGNVRGLTLILMPCRTVGGGG